MNFFTSKTLKISNLLIISLLGIGSLSSISAKNYHDFYVFGDSLNDANPDTKAVGGGIYPPQNYYVGMSLFDKPMLGYKEGGHVIALNGNQISNTLSLFPSLANLFENNAYFDRSNVGENNLYYISIGNNDSIISNPIVAPFPELDIFHLSQHIIKTRTDYAKNMLITLGNNGKNTIITSNLLQIELTPTFQTLRTFPRWDFVSFIDAIVLNNQIHWRFNDAYSGLQDFVDIPTISEFIYQLGFVTDYKIRQLSNQYVKPDNINAVDYIKEFRSRMYSGSFIGTILSPVWNTIVEHFEHVIEKYTENYSTALLHKYFSTNENIVFLDFRALLLEALNKPQEFGIDNILVPQCTSGIASVPDSICQTETRYFNEDQTYLFGDLAHPSAYTHELMGNYIVSILNAPVLFSSLVKHAENSLVIRSQQIGSQLTPLRFNKDNLKNGFSTFVNYHAFSGRTGIKHKGVLAKNYFSNYLNLGGTYVLDQNQVIGALINVEVGKAKPYNSYQFNTRGFALDLFYQLSLSNNLWLNFDIGTSHLKANKIKRTINFNSTHHRTEEGKTSVQGLNTHIRAGYDFEITPQQFLSPFLGSSFNQFKVKQYHENSQRSTAMQFGQLKVNQKIASLGLQYHVRHDDFTISSEIALQHDFSNTEKKIAAGLRSAPRNFTRLVTINEKNWVSAHINLNKKLNNKFQLNVASGIQYSRKSKQKINLSIGLNTQL